MGALLAFKLIDHCLKLREREPGSNGSAQEVTEVPRK